MMIKAGERVFCDTSVLLAAVDQKRASHAQALAILNTLPQKGIELDISGQVVREFLVVSTRPAENNGLGQSLTQALDNVAALKSRLVILEETHAVHTALMQLARTHNCSGKKIHDCNIVATMLAHGVQKLITLNTPDFTRFDDIALLRPDQLAP